MKRHLNTLFVSTQGAYIHKDNDNVVVSVERQEKLRLPVHNLGSIVCFGNVLCSPFLLGHCADNRVSVSFLTERGRFLARVQGSTEGNVLLRRDQYRIADDPRRTCDLARVFVQAKIANSRVSLQRFVRDHQETSDTDALQSLDDTIGRLGKIIELIERIDDIDAIRGYEGEAAKLYFSVFDLMILQNRDAFSFSSRSRRPPLDNVNALLSLIYTILAHDVQSALETVGLDPAVGFLHRDRPGRPGLALDLMEEFRPWLADRVVLGLINRSQLSGKDFERTESGAVHLRDDGRKMLLTTYQTRKQDEIMHPYLQERASIGSLFFIQALLLSRFLRADMDGYPPFLPK